MIALKVMTLCISFNGMQFIESIQTQIGIFLSHEGEIFAGDRTEGENCLHKYLFLFAHSLQFCMKSCDYASKD